MTNKKLLKRQMLKTRGIKHSKRETLKKQIVFIKKEFSMLRIKKIIKLKKFSKF